MSRQRSIEKILASKCVTIGELARLTGLRYSTLKYYTELGILPYQPTEENLTRRFDRAASIKRLEEIRSMKDDGSSMQNICTYYQQKHD